MKEHHNINFNLFCQRKGFNLENWIKNNHESTFKDLRKQLLNIKVMPPSLEDFDRIKEKYKVVEEKPETIEEKPEKAKVVKKTTRRRRKAKKDES